MEGSSLVFSHNLTNLFLLGRFCFGASHGLLAFGFLLRCLTHLDFDLDVAFAFFAFAVFLAFVAAAICFTFHRLLSFGYFIGLLVFAYFIDLLPLHFHLRRDRLFGELGSDFQSPLIFADLAQ